MFLRATQANEGCKTEGRGGNYATVPGSHTMRHEHHILVATLAASNSRNGCFLTLEPDSLSLLIWWPRKDLVT